MDNIELAMNPKVYDSGTETEKSSPTYHLTKLRATDDLPSTGVSTDENAQNTNELRKEIHLAPVDRGFPAWAMASIIPLLYLTQIELMQLVASFLIEVFV
jgi:hypothetical protein